MMKARIRLMERMVPSELKNQVVQEVRQAVEELGTKEEKACFYQAYFQIVKEKEELAEQIDVLRAWAAHAEGEERLLAWGNLLAVLDSREEREEIVEIWSQAKEEWLGLPEREQQEMLCCWMRMMPNHLNKHRLMRLYPLESRMGGETRRLFYQSMVVVYVQDGNEQAACDWAVKGMSRLENMLEADQLFLYLEFANVILEAVDGRETETAKLMRRQWELAQELGAYGTGAKLSLILLHVALDEHCEKEARKQWAYLEEMIGKFGFALLFSDRERVAKRWMKKMKRRLNRLERGAGKVFWKI